MGVQTENIQLIQVLDILSKAQKGYAYIVPLFDTWNAQHKITFMAPCMCSYFPYYLLIHLYLYNDMIIILAT